MSQDVQPHPWFEMRQITECTLCDKGLAESIAMGCAFFVVPFSILRL
jgi:hypothetical protein